MAATLTGDNNPSPSTGAGHVLLRVYFPAASSSLPAQAFEHGIQLPTITTVAALLTHIQLRCIPTLPPTEYLDPDTLYIVWKPELNRANTILHETNLRIEMANVWSHGGGDVLVVRIKARRGSDASEGGVGAARGDSERHQAEVIKREAFKRQVEEKIASDALHARSSSAAAANPSRQDEKASMEDVRFTDSNAPSPAGHSSQETVQIEPQTWGGATLTNPVSSRAHSQAGSDMFAGASDPNASSLMPADRGGPNPSTFSRRPDSRNNNSTLDANHPGLGGRGGKPSSVSTRPGFWREDGSWDSEAAARANAPAAPSSDFSAESSHGAGRGRIRSTPHDRPAPLNPHVWSEDTLGDRPQNLEHGPPIKEIRSIFPRTRGERSLSQSRHAPHAPHATAGRQGRGVQGQHRPNNNPSRFQGGDENWGASPQQARQNLDPPPHEGWRNPNTIPHQSQPRNRDSSTRQPNPNYDVQDQSGEEEDQSSNWGGGKGSNSPKGRW